MPVHRGSWPESVTLNEGPVLTLGHTEFNSWEEILYGLKIKRLVALDISLGCQDLSSPLNGEQIDGKQYTGLYHNPSGPVIDVATQCVHRYKNEFG
ncbi:hypothetical protein RRG08_015034 [Elysia crispata]|uniref:Uncharacterized protein n=1 Tax=Elysia crispata TaxID=231223 RepID=A0AAE1B725_9GAST|nr:hypothetical protein RRG08_015034 [Elysia crispata]